MPKYCLTIYKKITNPYTPGHLAQAVKCLTADVCLTANSRVGSLILVKSHTFVEIDHGLISTVSPFRPLNHKQRYVHEIRINCLFKPAQEKSVVRWANPLDMTVSVNCDVKQKNKPKPNQTIHLCNKDQCVFYENTQDGADNKFKIWYLDIHMNVHICTC